MLSILNFVTASARTRIMVASIGPTNLLAVGAAMKLKSRGDPLRLRWQPIIFFSFSAQKTHVKPQIHLTLYQSARSAWRIRYVQTAILDI